MDDEDEYLELKPCPFCGELPTIGNTPTPYGDLIVISCLNDKCPAEVAVAKGTLEIAEEAWNKRAD